MAALVFFFSNRTRRACNFCDLRWSSIEKIFLSPSCFCWIEALSPMLLTAWCYTENRKAADLTEFQSSVLCDLQVEDVDCIKMCSWKLVGHNLGYTCGRWEETCLSSSAIACASSDKSSFDDWPAIVRRSCMIHVSCPFTTVTLCWSHASRFSACVYTLVISNLAWCSCWHLQPRIQVPGLYVKECVDHSLPQFGPICGSILI